MTRLYWGAHTCAIGIHILLEETGMPYDMEELDVGHGATRRPPFNAINPKGKVPTLICDDGSVLTEFGAIASWLARTNPHAALLPADPMQEARTIEVMEYVEGTIHGQGYTRLMKPDFFVPDGSADDEERAFALVKAQGRQIVETGFALLDTPLARYPYAAGERMTIADAALFYVERWAAAYDIALPVNVHIHFQRMLARPAVGRVSRWWAAQE